MSETEVFYVKAPAEISPDEAIIIQTILVADGDLVFQDQPILEIETSKAIHEIFAKEQGIIKLFVVEGQQVEKNSILAEISMQVSQSSYNENSGEKSSAKLTKYAMEELSRIGISSEDAEAEFKDFAVVTRNIVLETFKHRYPGSSTKKDELTDLDFDTYILGFGHRGKTLKSYLTQESNERKIAFVNYKVSAPLVLNNSTNDLVINLHEVIKVRGARTFDLYWCVANTEEEDFQTGIFREFEANIRTYVSPKSDIQSSLPLPIGSLYFPFSSVGTNAKIGNCVTIENNVIVGANCSIGDFSILSNGSSIAHDSSLGRFCSISDGARIAGRVRIGNNTLIGLNASVNSDVTIGNNVIVYSGASVYKDVPDESIVDRNGKIFRR